MDMWTWDLTPASFLFFHFFSPSFPSPCQPPPPSHLSPLPSFQWHEYSQLFCLSETSLITSCRLNAQAKPKRVSGPGVTVGHQCQLLPFWCALTSLEESVSPPVSGMGFSDTTGLGPAAKPIHFDPAHGQSRWHFLSSQQMSQESQQRQLASPFILTQHMARAKCQNVQILPAKSLNVEERGTKPESCSAHISYLVQTEIL